MLWLCLSIVVLWDSGLDAYVTNLRTDTHASLRIPLYVFCGGLRLVFAFIDQCMRCSNAVEGLAIQPTQPAIPAAVLEMLNCIALQHDVMYVLVTRCIVRFACAGSGAVPSLLYVQKHTWGACSCCQRQGLVQPSVTAQPQQAQQRPPFSASATRGHGGWRTPPRASSSRGRWPSHALQVLATCPCVCSTFFPVHLPLDPVVMVSFANDNMFHRCEDGGE